MAPLLAVFVTFAGVSLGTSVLQEVIVFSLCVLAVGGVVAVMFRVSYWKRVLRYEPSFRRVVVLRSKSRHDFAEQARCDVGDCRFVMHAVRLVVLRNRNRTEMKIWNGLAAVVHVGEARFFLACEREPESIKAYAKSLPGWLPPLDVGEPIEADAYGRIW